MLDKQSEKVEVITPVGTTDDAQGVKKNEPKYWFVAVVNNRSEHKSADGLQRLGCETFAPTMMVEVEDKKGQLKKKEKLVLPAMVLVRCTETLRQFVVQTPYVNRFRVDLTRPTVNGKHPLLIISDKAVESFRIALDNMRDEEIRLEETPFVLGESVIVKTGRFKGVEGSVVNLPNGQQKVVISLGSLGCFKLAIPRAHLRRLR